MGAIIGLGQCEFESPFVSIKCSVEEAHNYGVSLAANECNRALGIVFSKSPERWLKVAQAFTLELERAEHD
jgi:hypothetical protein